MDKFLDSVRINDAGETLPYRNWHWDSGVLADYDMVMLKEGTGAYFDGSTRWPASRGSCMLFRRGRRYTAVQNEDDPVAMLHLHFDHLDAQGQAVDVPEEQALPLFFRVERFDFVFGLFRNAVRYTRMRKNEESMAMALVWFKALWLELRRQQLQPRWEGRELQQAQQVEALCREIRNNIGRRWSIEDISNALGCAAAHSGRLFHKYCAVSPGEFVVRARIEAAQDLLRSSSLNVTQIADVLGFCDVYVFSRQFKQRTGLSPRAFRLSLFPSYKT